MNMLETFVETQASWVCRKPQTKPRGLSVLSILLYNYMAIPSKHAVRSTANPQATEEAENLQCMFSEARSRSKCRQAGYHRIPQQTLAGQKRLIICIVNAQILCSNASKVSVHRSPQTRLRCRTNSLHLLEAHADWMCTKVNSKPCS